MLKNWLLTLTPYRFTRWITSGYRDSAPSPPSEDLSSNTGLTSKILNIYIIYNSSPSKPSTTCPLPLSSPPPHPRPWSQVSGPLRSISSTHQDPSLVQGRQSRPLPLECPHPFIIQNSPHNTPFHPRFSPVFWWWVWMSCYCEAPLEKCWINVMYHDRDHIMYHHTWIMFEIKWSHTTLTCWLTMRRVDYPDSGRWGYRVASYRRSEQPYQIPAWESNVVLTLQHDPTLRNSFSQHDWILPVV